MTLEALKYSEQGDKARLELLDQRRLPLESAYISIAGPQEGWHAIKVRSGARLTQHGVLISLIVCMWASGTNSEVKHARAVNHFQGFNPMSLVLTLSLLQSWRIKAVCNLCATKYQET